MPTAATQPVAASPAPQSPREEEDAGWQRVKDLLCQISIGVGVSGFGLKELLQLKPESIVRSQTSATANLPVRVNGELIAWSDFEVRGSKVCIRLTELA